MSSQSSEDPAENQNDEISEDDNAKREKSKNDQIIKKEKKVKVENQAKYRKLSDISAPRRRRILHNTMMKYHTNPYYKNIDIAKKLLKKLRVHNTPYFMKTIRRDMEKWMSDNVSDSDTDIEDSKKDSKNCDGKNVLSSTATKDIEEIEKQPSNAKTLESSTPAAENTKKVRNGDDKVDSTVIKINEKNVTNSGKVKCEKIEIPLIDLTEDSKKEVKKIEVITIDDDSNVRSEKAINEAVPPVVPYPLIGYNHPITYYYPDCYPYCATYHDVNVPFYTSPNPYILPYGYPYPYFVNPSDMLPTYPVDEDCEKESKTDDSKIAAESATK